MQWSQPEGDPAVTNEGRTWLDSQAEYRDVVLAWRRSQEQGPEQPEESRGHAGTDTDFAADESEEADELSEEGEDDAIMLLD